MKLKLALLILSCMVFVSCDGKNVVVVSLRGSSSSSANIHTAVEECAANYGYSLTLGENWTRESGDGVAGNEDARRLIDEINDLAERNGGDKSNLSLLVVGKSAGGVLAWNAFKRHYDDIAGFYRVSLVMVDPHGSVWDDGRAGTYSDGQDLWWPESWSSDTDFLRVYNVYQHEKGLTGASFPDRRVYTNIRITESSISHSNIPDNHITREVITDALAFAAYGQ